MRKRVIAFIVVLALMISIIPMNVFADGEGITTESRDGATYLLNQDGSSASKGWHEIDGVWYYVEAEGKAATGWRSIGGKWYHFNETFGHMDVGYRVIDGKKYMFKNSGAMYENEWIEAGSWWLYAKRGGELANGWQQINGKWYYFTLKQTGLGAGPIRVDLLVPFEEGAPYLLTDEAVIGNELHDFDSSGAWTGKVKVTPNTWRKTGVDNKKWYYIDGSGNAAIGWKKINGKWYYFHNGNDYVRGYMRHGIVELDGTNWYFNEDGSLREKDGWVKKSIDWGGEIDEDWYYLNSDGSLRTGWVKDGGKWYYLGPITGVMLAGPRKIDGKIYCLNDDGSLRETAGWNKLGNDWVYLNADGTFKTGWLKDGGKWYYIGEKFIRTGSGVGAASGGMSMNSDDNNTRVDRDTVTMVSDCVRCVIDDKMYAFDASGAMRTGWVKNDEYGKTVWYYCGADGAMYTDGTYTIGGTSYTFDSLGRMK